MKESEIKVGRYYLINLKIESCSINPTELTGRLMMIDNCANPFIHNGRRQIYFIEFLDSNPRFHSGLGKASGQDEHCYFVSSRAIIREVALAEVLAHKL